MALSYEGLADVLQRHAPGDIVAPAFFANYFSLLDPRKGGAVHSHFVGPAAAFGHINEFIVPRDGIYWIEAQIFARAGTVRVWFFNLMSVGAGVAYVRHRVVSTSTGFKIGPYVLLLRENEHVRIENEEATIAGDETDVSIVNFELALG